MVGKIIYCKYLNFDFEIVNGIFLVIYDESIDKNTDHDLNLCCLKVTSKDRHEDIYSVQLTSDFLKYPSFVLCSKPHLVRSYDNVISVIGTLNKKDIKNVYKKYKKYVNETLNELKEVV